MKRVAPITMALVGSGVALAVEIIEPIRVYEVPVTSSEEAAEKFWRILREHHYERLQAHIRDPYYWKQESECPQYGVLKAAWIGLTRPLDAGLGECKTYWLRTPVDINGKAIGPAERVDTRKETS